MVDQYTIPSTCLLFVLLLDFRSCTGLVSRDKIPQVITSYIYIAKRYLYLYTLILTVNNFIFNGNNYLQIKGCAMETNSSPSFANIFLGKFEEQLFIYPVIQNLHKIYLRYIHDIDRDKGSIP